MGEVPLYMAADLEPQTLTLPAKYGVVICSVLCDKGRRVEA